MNYTLITWCYDDSVPTIRTGMVYGLAFALATTADYAKSQIVDEEFNTIVLETTFTAKLLLHDDERHGASRYAPSP